MSSLAGGYGGRSDAVGMNRKAKFNQCGDFFEALDPSDTAIAEVGLRFYVFR